MSKAHHHGLSSAEPRISGARYRLIAEFWSALEPDGETGAANREDLDMLRQQVTECLMRDPPDMRTADSITARAALMIAGCRNV